MKDWDLAVRLRNIWSDLSIIAKATRAQIVDNVAWVGPDRAMRKGEREHRTHTCCIVNTNTFDADVEVDDALWWSFINRLSCLLIFIVIPSSFHWNVSIDVISWVTVCMSRWMDLSDCFQWMNSVHKHNF